MFNGSSLLRDGFGRIGILIASLVMFSGCFRVPDESNGPSPAPSHNLSQQIQTALAGHREDAIAYAGLYAILAERLESNAYPTTTSAATVAGRAADILKVPGLLKDIVNDELNPLLGTPQPLTPELSAKAAAKLRELFAACQEAAR